MLAVKTKTENWQLMCAHELPSCVCWAHTNSPAAHKACSHVSSTLAYSATAAWSYGSPVAAIVAEDDDISRCRSASRWASARSSASRRSETRTTHVVNVEGGARARACSRRARARRCSVAADADGWWCGDCIRPRRQLCIMYVYKVCMVVMWVRQSDNKKER